MTMKARGTIEKVAGPLVIAKGMRDADMFDMVLVSDELLTGEIIEIHGDRASIQVYEETGGLGPGEPVVSLGTPMSVELGPGMISGIFDGIQRPLAAIYEQEGNRLGRGIQVSSLDREKEWTFVPTASVGDRVQTGDILGTVEETPVVELKIMVPHGVSGTIKELHGGDFTIEDTVAVIENEDGSTHDVSMLQRWPVRRGRPYKQKLNPDEPLITGQRVIDALFPIAKGGTAAVPGPFGSGKTVVQHQLAKWAEVDIVVYIGCGERGNEMTEVLDEFPALIDPNTGRSLMERTVLIANTSDMPVAAREASIYTGITIAEYYRDQGFSVALMADSTSRWAEALREMSGRLEEMPGEEGYPAYLGSRLAQFYERAGRVITLGSDNRDGSLSVIGAVSPPGGDISEPVAQATLRIVKVFWNLDAQLAYARHFPAISWLDSYSLYTEDTNPWFDRHVARDWSEKRGRMIALLDQESELEEIVQLVGMDSLSPADRLKMEAARSIREDFLHQNAYDDVDTYTPLEKQNDMIDLVLAFYDQGQRAVAENVSVDALLRIDVREDIGRFKYLDVEKTATEKERILKELADDIEQLIQKQKEAI